MADRTRIIVELVLAALCAVAAVVTAVVPEWIEETTGLSPDAGSGLTEWGIVFGLGALAVLAGTRGVLDLRRRRIAEA